MTNQSTGDKILNYMHSKSIYNFKAIQETDLCGCFFCLSIFPSTDIKMYVDNGKTALCPNCEVDGVLPCDGETIITIDLLKKMNIRWFDHAMESDNSTP